MQKFPGQIELIGEDDFYAESYSFKAACLLYSFGVIP